jgi:hypothetical protein
MILNHVAGLQESGQRQKQREQVSYIKSFSDFHDACILFAKERIKKKTNGIQKSVKMFQKVGLSEKSLFLGISELSFLLLLCNVKSRKNKI